jgi:tetratricopeptide (TPR) repeat protein
MMSKEIVFTAPLLVMLYDRAFRLQTWKGLIKPGHGRGWLYIGLWMIAIGTFTAMQIGARGDASILGVTMTPVAYLYTQCWAIAHYLQLTIWPSGLTLDYGFRPIHGARGIPGFVLLAAMGAATLYAWTRVARLGWLAFLGSMFFIVLAPSSSFVPQVLEIAAERRVYLAVVPILIMLTVGVEWLRRKYAAQLSPKWIVAPVAIALCVTTAARSYAYNDPVELWRSATHSVPENSRAFEQYGLALFTAQPPQYPAAESAFVRALAMDSSCQSGCLQYATLLSKEGRYAEATPLLQRQAGEAGGTMYNFMATRLLAFALMKQGHYDLAIPYLERLVQAQPSVSHLVALGVSYLSAGMKDEAIETFRHMATLDPENEKLQRLSARLLDGVGHPEALSNLQDFAFTMAKDWM